MFFLAAEPLTDKITWQNGNKYTYRLRASTYMQVAMLMPAAIAAKKKRWALVYPNFEYGQSAAENFKTLMKKAQPDVEFVTEQAPPLGKIDAGAVAQAIDDAKPDAIFNVLFGGDLAKFVREGNTRGVFKDRTVVSLLSGEPEYLDPLKDEAPVGWIVTGYPWDKIKTPEHQAFVAAYQKKYNDYPRLGSVVGYVTMKSIAAGIAKAKSTDTEKLVAAFKGLKVDSPFGPFDYRASDHQATMGAFVGKIGAEGGKGTMVDFKYVDGASVLPSDAEVKKLRPAELSRESLDPACGERRDEPVGEAGVLPISPRPRCVGATSLRRWQRSRHDLQRLPVPGAQRAVHRLRPVLRRGRAVADLRRHAHRQYRAWLALHAGHLHRLFVRHPIGGAFGFWGGIVATALVVGADRRWRSRSCCCGASTARPSCSSCSPPSRWCWSSTTRRSGCGDRKTCSARARRACAAPSKCSAADCRPTTCS